MSYERDEAMTCSECHDLLQSQLDGVSDGARAVLDEHLAECPQCREWHAAVRVLEEGLRLLPRPAPPAELAEHLTGRLMADFRSRRRWRMSAAAGAALAASMLLAVLASGWLKPNAVDPWPVTPDANQSIAGKPSPIEGIREGQPPTLPLAVAQAVEGITERITTEAVTPARELLPEALPMPTLGSARLFDETLDPAAAPLREARQGMSAGLEPMTTSARRAVELLLRDLPPMDADPKTGT